MNNYHHLCEELLRIVDKNQSKDPLLIDGLNILLKNNQNNLGWRIASKFFLNEKDFKVLIKSTNDNLNCKIVNLISKTCKSEIEILLKIVRTISKNKKIDNTDLDKLFNLIDINPYTLAKDMVGDQLELVDQKKVNSGLRKIPIKTTTVQSSKGLSADYVFITHFDNQYFIKDKNKTKISDQDICSLLVALTRAKKKVFLISSNTKIEPTFLKWIKSERVEKNSHDHL
jgi:superfamily I DNA/RNA helicase